MVVLYICKFKSINSNGVFEALKTEIKGLSKYANVGIFDLDNNISIEGVANIFYHNKYESIEKLPSPFNRPDIVVFEEVYKFEYISIYKTLLSDRIPYVIIPHGSLVKKEQKRKFIKKKTANVLFFRSFIKHANAIQFLNEQEKKKSIYNSQNSVIVPNSVDIKVDRTKKYKKKKNSFVYIGRYSVKTKGLDLLVETCRRYEDELRKKKISIDLYGSSDNNDKSVEKIKATIDKEKLHDIISINGPVYNKEKTKVLLEHQFFIQVSRHEGQPMGIIEALMYGLPCVVTEATSFGDFCENNNCGIKTRHDVSAIREAIIRSVNIGNDKYSDWAINAEERSKKCFNMLIVGNETFKKYEAIMNDYDRDSGDVFIGSNYRRHEK